jgi:hypothetical protein
MTPGIRTHGIKALSMKMLSIMISLSIMTLSRDILMPRHYS